jgi:hypothetical protein
VETPTEPPAEETPAEEPPAEEAPVEEPTTEPPVETPKEEHPGGGGHPLPETPEAVLNVPSEVLTDAPTVLDGTESVGQSLSCKWTISTGKEIDSLTGCLVVYSFESPGTSTIKLTVRSAGGASDSSRQAVTVLPVAGTGTGTGTGTTSKPGQTTGSGSSTGTGGGGWLGGLSTGPGSTIAGATAYAVGARHAWDAPARVHRDAQISLVAAVDQSTARCTWRISMTAGERKTETLNECSTSLLAPSRGAVSIRLTIESGNGSVSSVRRTINVSNSDGPLAAARRAQV